MTSASELFSNWLRSRSAARNPNPSPHPHFDEDPTLPSHHLHRHSRRLLRRRRHLSHRAGPQRIFESEHELLQSDHSSPNTLGTISSNNGETVNSRVNQLTLIRSGQANDLLPGAVLQARARLIERLRGISFTEDRQNITSSSISRNEFVDNVDFRITSSDDWEIEGLREWIQTNWETEDSNQEIIDIHNISTKKPPGLCSETICSLHQELFKVSQGTAGIMRASLECCICLERFLEGDKLFRLHCEHRFHPACLEPWLRTCGDCPYCRARI